MFGLWTAIWIPNRYSKVHTILRINQNQAYITFLNIHNRLTFTNLKADTILFCLLSWNWFPYWLSAIYWRSFFFCDDFFEIQYTYQTIHPLKIYSSVFFFFNIFTELCSHQYSPFLEHLHDLKNKICTI